MIENLLYVIAGFAVTYLSLEVAWQKFLLPVKSKAMIR
jgi:hypothetical protein